MKNETDTILEEAFTILGYPLQETNSRIPAVNIELYYRNNPDGTLRWAWPATLRKPEFLRFYNTSSRRAGTLALLIRILFFLRLQRYFISGKTTITMRTGHYELFTARMGKAWSFFSGTAGVNRTAILYARGLFHKIPVGIHALEQLVNEFKQHRHWKYHRFESIEMATAVLKGRILIQNDIAAGGKRSGKPGNLHWNAIRELTRLGHCSIQLSVMPRWNELDEKLDRLQQSDNKNIPQSLVSRLKALKDSIPADTTVAAGYSHGDFTPWNLFIKTNRIALIDWEMADACTPVLFDAFHFIYQPASLVDHCGYTALKQRIRKMLSHPVAQQMIREDQVDVALHHRLYLLFTATWFLDKYREQETWQPQQGWSLRVWNDSLDDFLLEDKRAFPRQLLTGAIFDFLKDRHYAALKWMAASPMDLSADSDIDLCMDRNSSRALGAFLKQHPLVKKVRIQQRSFMRNYGIWLHDQSFLSVDTIWQFRRRHLVMMDATQVARSATPDAFGIKVPLVHLDFTYTWLFYLLNHAALPEKYRHAYRFHSKRINRELNEQFQWKNILGLRSYREVFDYDPAVRKKVVNNLQAAAPNRGWSAFKHRLLFVTDLVREHFFRKGFIITFSGVDGAGKSTVIETVKQQIEKRYRRKVVVLRHRPALLPMLSAWKEGRKAAEQRAADRLPRQGNNKSLLSSLIRFGYYYADYLLGQFVVQVKYVWRGYVVLYDRYYFDFINDSKRSNIVLPNRLTRAWYTLLLKPSYNFFLYADEDTILGRKKELDRKTIRELTGNYLSLFSRLGKRHRFSKYIAVENQVLPDTTQTIIRHVKKKLV